MDRIQGFTLAGTSAGIATASAFGAIIRAWRQRPQR